MAEKVVGVAKRREIMIHDVRVRHVIDMNLIKQKSVERMAYKRGESGA